MSYEYEHVVSFEYKRYKLNKHIEFTDEIKVQLDNFYKYIDKLTTDNKGKFNTDKLTTDLSQMYAQIREVHIKPLVTQYFKYKNIAYTQVEVDFIFQCSYRLIEKFGLSQNNLSKIFGMKPNKFAKLGCFPKRSFDAYTKLDDVSARKSLIPNDTNSEGIRIAECINKNVQAVYNCSAFIGITNTLDIFANISSTDDKLYVLTEISADSDLVGAVLSYPRFLFASANNFDNIPNNYKAGAIKEKVIELLNMRVDSVLIHSELLDSILQDGDDYSSYIKSANVDRLIAKYRSVLQILQGIEEGSFDIDGFAYDKELYKAVGLKSGDEALSDEETLYEYLDSQRAELNKKLKGMCTYASHGEFNKDRLIDYQQCMLRELVRFYQMEDEITSDDKMLMAAMYWVLEATASSTDIVQSVKDTLEYLKTARFLGYVDSIHKEITKNSKSHLLYVKDKCDLHNILQGYEKYNKNGSHPVLLYIDAGAYGVSDITFSELFDRYNLVIVIKDKIKKPKGFRSISKPMGLYIGERDNG